MKILNFGSLNLDFVYGVDQFVRPGETKSSLSMETFCGGKGLNQSIAISKAGVEVYHAGAIGKSDGDILLDLLIENGVNTDYIMHYDDVPTGHAIIQVDRSGQNCILLYGGANQMITKDHVDRTLSNFTKGDILLLQNEINMMDYIIKEAYTKGLIIALNPSPMDEKILMLPLEYVDYFILNEVEGADISSAREEIDILEALINKYPNSKIVLTLGENGSIYKDSKVSIKQGIYNAPVADTTGAGDTFTGYFIGSIATGNNVSEALRLASLASAISVSRSGAASSIPDIDEVKNSSLELK